MAMKPNYKFNKRQRDLTKKKQQDEKRLKKRSRTTPGDADEAGAPLAPQNGPAEPNAGE
ncbi:MAG TPA: hypothetical protein VGC30_08465 [Dokdonella sp.]